MLRPAAAQPGTARQWGQGVAVLTILIMRAAYCAYAVGVVVANLRDFARPVLAVTALLLALVGSISLGILVEREQSVSLPVAILDAAVAGIAMATMSAALDPGQRAGSQNWTLAYAVGCSIWLAFSRRLAPALLMSTALGVTYGVQALRGVPTRDGGLTVTALINAVSPVLYFGIAVLVFRVVRLFATQIGEIHAQERRNQREVTALRERDRLFAGVHAPVVSALELIADPGAAEAETRDRARAEAVSMRRAIGMLGDPTSASGFKARLAELVAAHGRIGRRLELVDDEIAREPSHSVAETLCSGLEALVAAGGSTADRPTWVHAASDDAGVELVVRLPGYRGMYRAAVSRVRTALGPTGGNLEILPALTGEVRFRMTTPA